MSPYKIAIVTAARSEYGLLKPLMAACAADKECTLQILVTGMHLSPEFGSTYKHIEADGFQITEKIEILLSSDTQLGAAKSLGLATLGFAESFARLKPDAVVVLGDRYETLGVASAALLQRIPIAHIHGGETTKGAIDDAMRHAITQMSSLHFASTEAYKNRIFQMGLEKGQVFHVGAPICDVIAELKLGTKEELEKELGFSLGKKSMVITFHPETLAQQSSEQCMQELLSAMETLPEFNLIFTLPNSDADNASIKQKILKFAAENPDRVKAYDAMGHHRYLRTVKHCDLVLGNSSSGILEAPLLGTPTVNIGGRQEGRIAPPSVFSVETKSASILQGIEMALKWPKKANLTGNPYFGKDVAQKMKQEIKNFLKAKNH